MRVKPFLKWKDALAAHLNVYWTEAVQAENSR